MPFDPMLLGLCKKGYVSNALILDKCILTLYTCVVMPAGTSMAHEVLCAIFAFIYLIARIGELHIKYG